MPRESITDPHETWTLMQVYFRPIYSGFEKFMLLLEPLWFFKSKENKNKIKIQKKYF